jgi:hypothetical protein
MKPVEDLKEKHPFTELRFEVSQVSIVSLRLRSGIRLGTWGTHHRGRTNKSWKNEKPIEVLPDYSLISNTAPLRRARTMVAVVLTIFARKREAA